MEHRQHLSGRKIWSLNPNVANNSKRLKASKKKSTTSEKSLQKELIFPSLTKRLSDILQQVQRINKEESSDGSPNEEEWIVKFAFVDVHGTLKTVLSKSYKKQTCICFWLSSRVFSNRQQSNQQEKISIWGWIWGLAKTAVDFSNLLRYEMRSCRLYARVLKTDNDVQSSWFIIIVIISSFFTYS